MQVFFYDLVRVVDTEDPSWCFGCDQSVDRVWVGFLRAEMDWEANVDIFAMRDLIFPLPVNFVLPVWLQLRRPKQPDVLRP
jgi:hypothetical protein